MRLSTGTLFGALDRLVESGLVEAGEEEKVEGRVRRSYTLTHDGHAALAAEAGRGSGAPRAWSRRESRRRRADARAAHRRLSRVPAGPSCPPQRRGRRHGSARCGRLGRGARLARRSRSSSAGIRQRAARRVASFGRGTVPRSLAGFLAIVNLAVALAGITAGVQHGSGLHVLGLTYGQPLRPATSSSTGGGSPSQWRQPGSSSGWCSADGGSRSARRSRTSAWSGTTRIFLANGNPVRRARPLRRLHVLRRRRASPPGGSGWRQRWCWRSRRLAARPRRLPAHSPAARARCRAVALVVLSRETWGAFFFLRWPLAAVVLLARRIRTLSRRGSRYSPSASRSRPLRASSAT